MCDRVDARSRPRHATPARGRPSSRNRSCRGTVARNAHDRNGHQRQRNLADASSPRSTRASAVAVMRHRRCHWTWLRSTRAGMERSSTRAPHVATPWAIPSTSAVGSHALLSMTTESHPREAAAEPAHGRNPARIELAVMTTTPPVRCCIAGALERRVQRRATVRFEHREHLEQRLDLRVAREVARIRAVAVTTRTRLPF